MVSLSFHVAGRSGALCGKGTNDTFNLCDHWGNDGLTFRYFCLEQQQFCSIVNCGQLSWSCCQGARVIHWCGCNSRSWRICWVAQIIVQNCCLPFVWRPIGCCIRWGGHLLIAPATRSCVHPSRCHLCISVAACLGQADWPNASHVDHHPTISYLWDLSVALWVPWECLRWSAHAGVSMLECPR